MPGLGFHWNSPVLPPSLRAQRTSFHLQGDSPPPIISPVAGGWPQHRMLGAPQAAFRPLHPLNASPPVPSLRLDRWGCGRPPGRRCPRPWRAVRAIAVVGRLGNTFQTTSTATRTATRTPWLAAHPAACGRGKGSLRMWLGDVKPLPPMPSPPHSPRGDGPPPHTYTTHKPSGAGECVGQEDSIFFHRTGGDKWGQGIYINDTT